MLQAEAEADDIRQKGGAETEGPHIRDACHHKHQLTLPPRLFNRSKNHVGSDDLYMPIL
jgi:hypothetical protein